MRVAIAVCGTKSYRGIPKYFYFLAKHLALQGVEVKFIVDSVEGIQRIHEVTGFPKGVSKIYDIGPTCQERLNVPATALWCWRVARWLDEHRDDFDVLHCGHVTPYFYLRLPRERRRPVVFQPFGNELDAFKNIYGGLAHYFYKFSSPVLRSCGHRAEAVAAEADWQVPEIATYYGRDEKDIFTLPAGVDVDFVREKAKAGLTREDLGLSDDDFVLLTVNTFHYHKDYPNLVRATDHLWHHMHLLVKSIMVGTGPESKKVESMIKEYGQQNQVLWLGNVPEDTIYSLYTLADAYVSPTMVTDFQMGILEAEALGKPIVSTAQDFLIDGNGYVVEMGNPRALAEGIIRVYGHWSGNNNRGFYEAMCRHSEEIAERYDFKEIAKKAIEKYKELA